ncbi:MAG TPA: hypothetical protein VIH86_06000 [Puia sp.]|jgi:hypothetical protein
MLRKILAIFCVFLMLLFHYGRMINYWGCEIIQATNSTTTCDCEKQSKDTNNDAQQSSSQKSSKDKTEDFFADTKNLNVNCSFATKINSSKANSILNLSPGFNSKIFQPPRS